MALLSVPELEGKTQQWPSLGGQVCDFIEANLVHGPGDLRGQPAELDDEKRWLIWRLYEVYPIDHPHAGRRRFKRAGIMLAKGVGKTEFGAWIAACEMHPDAPVRCVGWDGEEPIGGGVVDPYIPMVAYTEEQSDELAYGALKAILEESPLAPDFDIGLERIVRIRGDGRAVSLSAAPNARDGARTTFSLFDETHWFTLDRLKKAHQVMMANLPKRKASDAWSIEVTTAFEPGAGSVAEATYDYACSVRDGKIPDPRLMFYYRFAEADDEELATEEGVRRAVLEASGPTAEWRDIDSIAGMFLDPSNDRQYLRRVWLNQRVQQTHQAFDAAKFQRLAVTESPVIKGDLITLGFDGAQFRDATGLVATHVESGYQWVVGAWEQPIGALAEGWQVPVEEVDAVVAQVFGQYEVWRMYADPPYWQSWIATWQGRYGEDVVVEWWTNRRKPMATALESYDTAISEGSLSNDGHPKLVQHIANAHRHNLPQLDERGEPLWLIRKERPDSPNKIDLGMCAVLSWEARNDAIAAGATGGKKAGVTLL